MYNVNIWNQYVSFNFKKTEPQRPLGQNKIYLHMSNSSPKKGEEKKKDKIFE